ncbi:uncharacterized protein LOC123506447 isoform X2 [Portunus trituberculatus]|uniref:uncharacterized protein LOC123506447 isoform X2 n=1 Tax=Portunus trituberculatus TaxID=210409 RepID=UPI001E1CDDD5|nr:uncharacterized protein LOC123506447 isoform X2 [Portunus trituberculatus]
MSWCALVVVFSDNPTFLSVFAEMADEGRLMVWETKLLVITRLPLSSVEDLMQNYWTFSMMNTMFMKIKETAGINHFHGMKVNISWLPLTPYWMEEKRPGPNGTEARTYTDESQWEGQGT